jgi:amino acid transporter
LRVASRPLAVVFAMVAVLFTAYSMSQLALHLPSAGGMYTYVGRGLGPFFGWLVAWSFALAEPLVMPILLAASASTGRSSSPRTFTSTSSTRGLDSRPCVPPSSGC